MAALPLREQLLREWHYRLPVSKASTHPTGLQWLFSAVSFQPVYGLQLRHHSHPALACQCSQE